MANIITLKGEAEKEGYRYFNEHIRPLVMKENGAVDYRNIQEHIPFGESSSPNSEASKNMDYWNNEVGRKYGKKAKSREELAELLKKALEAGELIISLDDPRKFGEKTSFKVDPNKPIVVLKENETGRNELFCDLSNGDIFDREGFVASIGNGKYPGYTVASIDGLATPMSKADGVTSNNLG